MKEYIRDDDILWFDVPVGDILIMEILNCLGYLFYDGGCTNFSQDFIFLELGVQSPLVHILKEDEEMSGVIEVVVDA